MILSIGTTNQRTTILRESLGCVVRGLGRYGVLRMGLKGLEFKIQILCKALRKRDKKKLQAYVQTGMNIRVPDRRPRFEGSGPNHRVKYYTSYLEGLEPRSLPTVSRPFNPSLENLQVV